MAGWRHGWRDGWLEGLLAGWLAGGLVEWIGWDGSPDGWLEGWLCTWLAGGLQAGGLGCQMAGWKAGWRDGWLEGLLADWMAGSLLHFLSVWGLALGSLKIELWFFPNQACLNGVLTIFKSHKLPQTKGFPNTFSWVPPKCQVGFPELTHM